MKIVTVVGARPQFVKASVVSRALAKTPGINEFVVHTGQHYDKRMSRVFFDELQIPKPAVNLQIGSGSHGAQTGRMLERIEQILLDERPDAVLVYGDTNSTLAGALAAVKLHIPVAHVEAGLRSFNQRMPEEVNRILTDRISTLLFCPTTAAVENLRNEGLTDGVELVGDVMYDCVKFFSDRALKTVTILNDVHIEPSRYVLMTCHRAENTDDPARLRAIMAAAEEIGRQTPVVFPMHPRTARKLDEFDIAPPESLRIIEPVSYLEMLRLETDAAVIITDSGGVQKEAYIVGVPCITLREETEWVETLSENANILAGADADRILKAFNEQSSRTAPITGAAECYGNGQACERIATRLASS